MTETTASSSHTPLTVRPFQNADAPAVARLVTAGVRGHWTYTPEQFRESSDPARLRLVAERGGEVVATAHLFPFGPAVPDALRLDLAGEGAAFTPLYLALLACQPQGFTRLLGVTREDWPEKMDFFHAAGFRNAWQSWGAHLDLHGFDFERFRPLEERLYLAGYEVERLGHDAPEADWDMLHALYELGVRDGPRNPTTTLDPLSRETLRETVRREEVAFAVRFRGEIVASTRLTPRGREVGSEHTVTHPAHRSRGLATLVKASALMWAQREGYTEAGTGGTVLNLPMLRVNLRLGYVPEAMWVTWEKDLRVAQRDGAGQASFLTDVRESSGD
ncbi:GNAT family N-acetyltransferase [Deinococcus aluminii]|uniref:N-acetyltransferase domain-containing protein n=1 Tax=Deinococcus aluminii TaxID=1656885 RepID=A0ABP9XJZ5_9DEIO